eukprot:CAMPEP_0178507940 /NCGR_PEP_ID=MMETSP0696-20121128/20486_1 /TAXON_ID=265572 /ORGANISM="Extubocellulus spinifer, Strain CCMP396" /LENGTH=354 /DNA_ID=CAMNT_0020137459 /DNA_START=125 /DNA_END=1186 /DNA_ORIENTATION=+
MTKPTKRSLQVPRSIMPASSADYAPLLAGYFSGTLGLIVGHPLDSARIWIQSQSTCSAPIASTRAACSASSSTPTAIRATTLPRAHLVRPDMARSAARLSVSRAISSVASSPSSSQAPTLSIRSLYRGIACPMVTVGCIQALGFATYDSSRKTLKRCRGADSDGAFIDNEEGRLEDVALAAFASGALVSVVTAPLITIKIRQQLSGNGFWDVVRDTMNKPKGLRNIYAGYSAHLGLEALGRATFFACYEGLKQEMLYYQSDDSTTLALSQRMAAAAISGTISTSVLLPLDAIRTRINSCQVSPVHGVPTVRQATNELWQSGGARSFFRGYGAALVRAGPVASLSMPAYDLALEW